ncbi:galactan beta-1,4-galactosyltransferase GALS2 [Amaranthus tricolor]|uniref:galactan beta-1,4-galactosyltransferase GALS2 n=1 Tax=Amaranthus tricolor TaxID=29722 RepID=UPI0025846E5E|nr:galactan beta-1,4-galactosyltransferase GALS2 [Amaranthus tricolor]
MPLIKDLKPRRSDRNLIIGLTCNYATNFKLILFIIFLLFSTFLAFLHFIPSSYFISSSCLPDPDPDPNPLTHQLPTTDRILENGATKRYFYPFGSGAYSFIFMSAYRGGLNSFAIVGLSSKPLHLYSRPTYTCEYKTQNDTVLTKTSRILPDWGFGRIYTVLIINCTFPHGTHNPSNGGQLLLHIPSPVNPNLTDTIIALTEKPFSWDPSNFLSPPKFEFLYCGSPLYGNLSPQRMREWIAYHVRLFGKKSHFAIYDAGGVHKEVMEVLKPWMDLGYISIHDVKEEERFDGYYHNQFLIVNDCLHRYRFETEWMFFFDVDEYIYVQNGKSIRSMVDLVRDYTQFEIEQIPISNQICLAEDDGETSKKWAMEKLVYRNVKKVARRDRKYAIQPRNVLATGVHLSKNFFGESAPKTEKLIKYFHYHGTIVERRDTCKHFLNRTKSTKLGDVPFVLETSMRPLARLVKKFELETIGSKLESTKL